mmetsp:Transcript_34404/g.60310  ORF Transcript_34404/g.60310 Transcript_34404/m.60310 type:complete len:341 (-) Transcript_34404:1846-2868(-)|eukprot:CAMPEP_0204908780 /NCGR_PEP_ID=MMETSP1397-20131031/7660_1 /ASSEMBLY_ACC=CAM_ASM_000891 /TAXON_ID=49980 /ORGANISM="Climacostomum Climacostomum virens, Strain Stock W-24" /LENGTH=340 /DNA_ID=CAMNT_0052078415 /DNA_START=141 /DNA_END=1166 /DNA_ORIENTATION=+
MTSEINLSLNTPSAEGHTLPLLFDNEQLHEVDLAAVETITQTSFGELIDQHWEAGKSFIIAVAKGREAERPTVVHNFYFAAHPLNKTLFVVNNEEIISRFHKSSPLQPVNPLTNQPFIGEVEYYAVKKLAHEGVFIGTDYTFAYSDALRVFFQSNALSPADAELPKAEPTVPDFARMFDLVDISNLEIFSRMIDRQNEALLSRVHVPFRRAAFFGAFTVTSILVYLAALGMAGKFYVDLRLDLGPSISTEEAVVWCCLPLTSLLQDKATSALYSTVEDRGSLVAKTVSWVLYYALFSLVMAFKNYIVNSLFAIAVLGYGFFYTLYSLCLFFAHSTRKKLI